MDFTRYDEGTRALLRECIRLWQASEPGADKVLRPLKRTAAKAKDNTLMGFVYFHYADLYYYREPDYERFKESISLAIKFLMKGEDKELLARAYNFVALDAANHGCYDVAYNYYMTCIRICEDIPDALVPGIANSNLGQLFNELGYYELARRHVRRGIRIIKKHPEDGKYYRNLINMHFQDGMISLAMNRFADVEKTLVTIQELMDRFRVSDEGELRIPMAFIKIHVAIGHKDIPAAEQMMDELVDALIHEPQLYDCIDDVFTFLNHLIDERLLHLAERIIKAIEQKIESSGITHIMLMFTDILVAYYDAADNQRMVVKHLRKQHELSRTLRADQRNLHRFSIDLIRRVSDLQEEQEKVRQENAVLQVQAQTDALTGVPNRHAMNKELVAAFERAYKQHTPLGVEILDVDYFKEYNDTYGHRMGDVCLGVIAKELLEMAGEEGVFCARYGGDEFVIIYEGMTDEEVLSHAKRLESMLDAQKIKHKTSPTSAYVTISQGICNAVPMKKNKLWDYLEQADAALYSIKKSRGGSEHKNSICLASATKTFA